MIRIIDTHVHIWDLSVFKLPWLQNEGPVLNRTYLPDDYEKSVANDGLYEVEKTVYVEVDCAGDEKAKENRYIIDLCREGSTFYRGASISGRLDKPGFTGYIDKWRTLSPFVKGVRQVLHVPSARRGTCLGDLFAENVRYLGKKGLLFEGCLRNEELGDLYELAKKCPDTKIVLNHMGIVDPDIIAREDPSEAERRYKNNWVSNMTDLASLDNVWCKISGLNPAGEWSDKTLKPAVDIALDAFGEDRVVFASNYPVCNVSTKTDPWIRALIRITEGRGRTFQEKLFYKNAEDLYQL